MSKVQDTLTDKQINRALHWYATHVDHVNKLMLSTENTYPPSLNEDKEEPSLWKPEHWKWFIPQTLVNRNIVEQKEYDLKFELNIFGQVFNTFEIMMGASIIFILIIYNILINL